MIYRKPFFALSFWMVSYQVYLLFLWTKKLFCSTVRFFEKLFFKTKKYSISPSSVNNMARAPNSSCSFGKLLSRKFSCNACTWANNNLELLYSWKETAISCRSIAIGYALLRNAARRKICSCMRRSTVDWFCAFRYTENNNVHPLQRACASAARSLPAQ